MEVGYYAETMQQVHQGADASEEGSRPDNWSPEKLAKNDKLLAEDAKAKRGKKSPELIQISEIWHRTTTSDNLDRRREEKVETHWSMKVSTCKKAEPGQEKPTEDDEDEGEDEDEDEDNDLISFD